MTILDFLLLLLAITVFAVTIVRYYSLPAIIGYLCVGVLVGAIARTLVPKTSTLHEFADFGIVLLMFTIGLEFSLHQLIALKKLVLGLGFLQVFITFVITLLICWPLGLDWRTSIIVGCALSLSSTAIVCKMLAERAELNTPHGQKIFSISLFQDIAVVPMMIIIPSLGLAPSELAMNLGVAILKAISILFIILKLGQPVITKWLDIIARRKSQELFILNVLLISVGLSWVLNTLDLPMELGAFLAGLLIGETNYKNQVEEDIKPFRDVLLGLFFVILGMGLDFPTLIHRLPAILMCLILILVIKFVVITLLSLFFSNKDWVSSMRTGLWLCSASEFAFVLLNLNSSITVVPPEVLHILLAAMLLSLFIGPLVIQYSNRLVMLFTPNLFAKNTQSLALIAAKAIQKKSHVLIIGYGRSGKGISRFLEQEKVPYMAIDLDPDHVTEAAKRGENVVYGDGRQRAILITAGIYRAKMLMISVDDMATTTTILHHATSLNPKLPVIVRTKDIAHIPALHDQGATEVVCDAIETSLMLCSQALILLGHPISHVVSKIRKARGDHYALFYEYFQQHTEVEDEDMSIRTFLVPDNSDVIGEPISTLQLQERQLVLKLIRRQGLRIPHPTLITPLLAQDILVIMGSINRLKEFEESGFMRL